MRTAGGLQPSDGGGGSASTETLVVRGEIEFSAGVPAKLWSRTVEEGEVVSVVLVLTGGRLNGATTERSFGRIAAVTSRDVGGSTSAPSVGSGTDEVGTIPSGTMSAATVGEDLEIRVTYAATGTLYYEMRIEVSVILVPQA